MWWGRGAGRRAEQNGVDYGGGKGAGQAQVAQKSLQMHKKKVPHYHSSMLSTKDPEGKK